VTPAKTPLVLSSARPASAPQRRATKLSLVASNASACTSAPPPASELALRQVLQGLAGRARARSVFFAAIGQSRSRPPHVNGWLAVSRYGERRIRPRLGQRQTDRVLACPMAFAPPSMRAMGLGWVAILANRQRVICYSFTLASCSKMAS
jgi:hypothetical protein